MSGTAARTVAALVAVVVLGAGVFFLRDATISTHTDQDPDSRLEVLVEARVKGAETGQSLQEYLWAKVLMCRTEVAFSDPVTGLQVVDEQERVFRFVLQPSLDDTDRTQFRGCMEDFNIDHLQTDVRSMNELAASSEGDDDGTG